MSISKKESCFNRFYPASGFRIMQNVTENPISIEQNREAFSHSISIATPMHLQYNSNATPMQLQYI